jgi:hypothetical protein
MYQIEEFTKYIYQQVEDDENQEIPEEQREEENLEEEEESIIIDNLEDMTKNSKQGNDASNRLNLEHKRYKTYTMEYKKQIIQEVN